MSSGDAQESAKLLANNDLKPAFVWPSQPPLSKVLRRPFESAQYVSIKYTERLAETVIGLFKTEVIRRRGPWKGLEAVEFATLEWVDWFNNRRLLEPIGNIPPAEAEARFYADNQGLAMVA